MAEKTKYERIQVDQEEYNDNNDDNDEEIELHVATKPDDRRGDGAANGSSMFRVAFGTTIMILVYFTLSISLTFYQRWLLDKTDYPISIVVYHLVIKFTLSLAIRLLYECATGRSRILVEWRTSLRMIGPSAFASGFDIAFSNWGLKLVTISLYTMTKSTTIVFIMIFAILLGLEKKSWSLLTIVVMISSGLFMFTYKSTNFQIIGFSMLLFASLASGLRWTLTQLIMQKSKLALHNPIDMMFHMQPWMIVSVLPLALVFEGRRLYEETYQLGDMPSDVIYWLWFKYTAAACIAFLMELSEFLVLSLTSSLTLSIAGIFKEICQLILAVKFCHDQLSSMNIIGLVMCLGGISSHVMHKYWSLRSTDTLGGAMSDDNFDGSPPYLAAQSTEDALTEKCSVAGTSGGVLAGLKHRSGQRMPLLDSDDDNFNSDESTDVGPGARRAQNSSEVIFDVLKRRDAYV